MVMEVSAVKRLSRVEQQQRTREALLDAAMTLFAERGIEGTSIEEVTAQAGFTRGAFYSNFTDKNELVVETMRRFLEVIHAAAKPDDTMPDEPGLAYKERMERLRTTVKGRAEVLLAEVSLYAIRHEEVRAAIADLHQRQLAPAVDFVRTQLKSAGVKKPANVTYETLANIVQSLTFALALFDRVDPAIGAEKTLEIATRALINGLDR